MRRVTGTIKLTIFSALLISSVTFIFILMIISDVNTKMSVLGIDYTYSITRLEVAALFFVALILAYFISSVIIDRILNPIRLMITKVKDVGNMKFSTPLSINSEDEELKDYVTAFNDMSQKLNSYIERQNRFISDVSHELVTPITVVNGHTDLLIRWGKDNRELLDDELKIIKTEAMRMSDLIDSLLLLARSDNGKQKYIFENTNITRLIDESVSETRIIAPDYDIEVSVDENLQIKCDEPAIKRVLRIVFSNAVKYSDTNKRIFVKAYESGGLVNVSVRDFGIGIASEHLPRVFDRFYRVDDSRSRKTGSSGLGLSIAKEIITAHGGDIRITSEPGEGTEVSFIIPS